MRKHTRIPVNAFRVAVDIVGYLLCWTWKDLVGTQEVSVRE